MQNNSFARLDQQVAIVTGGTQGLGAAIAATLAQRQLGGLLICGRNVDKGLAQAAAIQQDTGVPVQFEVADLEQVADCRRVVQAAHARFGRIDILVNAAGVTDRGTLLDTDPALFDRLFAVNVRAPFFLMQDAVKHMRADGIEGRIVNIGSMSSLAGQPMLAAYCSSKGALATLTRNSAYGLLRNRIRVNALNIGWMASEGEDHIQRTHHGAAADWQAAAGQAQPFGRLIDPWEVARAVAFLASAESGLMTGSVIAYDQSVWGGYDAAPQPSAPL